MFKPDKDGFFCQLYFKVIILFPSKNKFKNGIDRQPNKPGANKFTDEKPICLFIYFDT